MPISNPLAGGARVITTETQVFSGAAPTSWTDLDLSATIGARQSVVLLKFTETGNVSADSVAVRKNGDTDEFYNANYAGARGVAITYVFINSTSFQVLLVATDGNGVIEWRSVNGETMTIDVVAYINAE